MATCRVKRNDDGRITKVTDENGVESQLYNTIVKHPIIENEEEAFAIFKSSLTDKVGEGAVFTHRVDGQLVNSYRDALRLAQEGEPIEIGFDAESTFTPVVTLNKTTDRSTEEGFINNLIENRVLSETKKFTNEGYRHQSAGQTENARIVNSEIAREEARTYLGIKGVNKDSTTFDLQKTNNTYRIIDRQGNFTRMSKEEMDNMTYEQLNKVTPYAMDYIIARDYAQNRPAYGFSQPEVVIPSRSETELQRLLTNLLSKMGVSTMSISEYVEKYNIKNGVDPSANALADIANKVVAFHEGEMGLEALTEEVAHFITEAMPQAQVESILENIHRSEEWNQHADTYREIYSKRYKGEELENAVRREVLGKVMTNSILNEFNTEAKTQEQVGFIQQALNLLTTFFENIQAYFRPEYKTQLDSYLNSVQEILRAEEIADMLNTDNFEGNSLVLYSMKNVPKSSIKLSTEKAVSSLRDQIQTSLSRSKKGSSINKNRLENLVKKLEENEEIGAVADLNSLTNTYITLLEKAVEDANKNNKSYIFTQEENIIYQALKAQILPSLGEIATLIPQKDDNRQSWNTLGKEIDDTILRATKLQGTASNAETSAVQNLIDKVIARNELPESSREYIEKWIESAEAETNWFHANFGMLTHSKDGLLNLAGMLQKDISTQSNIRWQDTTKKFQQDLRNLGVSERDIAQFVDGQFIVSEYDFNKFENVLERLEATIYKEVSESDSSIEDIINSKKERTREVLEGDKEVQFRRKLKDSRNSLLERKFVSDYYTGFETKLKDLDISQEGSNYILNYYGDMSRFKRAAQTIVQDENGNDKMILDYSQLSEQDKALRDSIMKDRSNAKSFFTELGGLKKGLKTDENGNVIVDTEIPLSHEAQIALDLQKLDESSANDPTIARTAGMPQIFLDTIRELEDTLGREAALEFLNLNAYTGFSDSYWDSLDVDGRSNVISRLEQLDDIEADESIRKLTQDREQLKAILRVYRNKNNPSEIDVDAMPRGTKKTVAELQQRLLEEYRVANALTKEIRQAETVSGSETTVDAVTSINQAYFNKLEDLGIEIDSLGETSAEILQSVREELEYASEHMTDRHRSEAQTAFIALSDYVNNYGPLTDSVLLRSIENLGLDADNITNAELGPVMQDVIRTRLLPYYTRFAPNQYENFIEELTEGSGNLADILPQALSRYDFMKIDANYSYFDSQQNDQINPNYVENFEGGYLQPKRQLSDADINNVLRGVESTEEQANLRGLLEEGGLGFESNKFQEVFQGNTDSNLYKAYEATLEYNREALSAKGIDEGYNTYTLPQIRKNRIQRFVDISGNITFEKLKEAAREELTYTEDDKVEGEKSKFGDSIKIIPKMYVDRLKNPNDVSTELFYSLALRAKEGYLREARLEHYGDFMALQDAIQNRTYKGKGDKPENTLKMFESAMDYSLFGIKETAMYPIETMFGTIDVAKLARNLLGYVKFRNLGLNVVIPITSYLTGRVTREMEKWVGEHMDVRSQNLGDNEFRKHAREAMSEIGQINTKGKINVLGQYFNAFDMSESFSNSNYGFFMRLLPRTGMMLHAGVNFPIYASTMLGVLHDFRVVNGSIMRFNQFERQKLSEGLTKKEVKNEWGRLEADAIYNYIDVTDGEISFNDTAIRSKVLNEDGNRMDDAQYENFKTEKINAIRAHVSNVITNIDGQIPQEARVHAQRHFLMNFFMTHRGWLSIVASRKFKGKHLNVETGEVEQGSYQTAWEFTGKYLKELKKSNFTKFVQSWKNIYDNADPADAQLMRRNMKRIGIEMAILNSLMLIGFLLNGLADDDEMEDNYGVQGMSYLFNRTLNELSSAQVGSINNFSEVIESPFVGWNTVKNFTDVGDLFNGDVVKHGSYRGLTTRERFLTKVVPGAKQVYDLSDSKRIKTMRNTYMFYNNANFNYTPLGNLYWLADGKE